MLVRVAPGQVRFVMPGLVADSRGVATGRDLVFRFGTLDRMVTFLRLLTAEQSLDELATNIRIVFARPGHGSREVLVFFEQASAQALDVVGRVARAAQGQGYTGHARHFVAIRDPASPLGYDVSALSNATGDLFLYGLDSETACRLEGDLTLLQLILRLELRREPHGPEGLDKHKLPPLAYVVARQGLGPTMVAYFHRAQIKADAALIEGAGRATGQRSSHYLFRIEQPPARLSRLLRTTPGLELYVPVTENLAVPYGYQHALHLDACRSFFQGERFILLAPGTAPPRIIEPSPMWKAVQDLVRMDAPQVTPVVVAPPDRARAPDLAVDLRLERATARTSAPVATLVPRAQVAWLKRLCFALPESVLARYRVAFLADELLVVAPEALDWLPFGQLLVAAGRGVLVPVGQTLRPAVSERMLEEYFATGDGSLVVFTAPGRPPLRIAASMLEPLERNVLARATLTAAATPPSPPGAPAQAAAPEIRYRPGAFMPLWGAR